MIGSIEQCIGVGEMVVGHQTRGPRGTIAAAAAATADKLDFLDLSRAAVAKVAT